MTANTATTPTKFESTHITMVLDRSGSMGSCWEATIASVNKYLGEARGDATLKESDFVLTIFDNVSIDDIRKGAPIALDDITKEDYTPRGGTPLYDAIGRGIDALDARLKAASSSKAILVIVTDGEENSSTRYTHAEISELVKGRQAAGWLVVFLGAGIEAASQGAALGVNMAYTAQYATDGASLSNLGSIVRGMSAGYAASATGSDAKAWLQTGAGDFTVEQRASMGDLSQGNDLANAAAVLQATQVRKTQKTDNKAKADRWAKP